MKGFLSSFTVSHMKLLKRLLSLLFKGMEWEWEWAYSILFLQRVGGVRGYSSVKKVEGIKHAIAVASGKGGVGKSTTAGISFFFSNKNKILGFCIDVNVQIYLHFSN